jgi:superfamily I DNA and RNA helicase
VLLDERADLLAAWKRRCANLLVDEVQDVDRSQLDLALLLAAPANRIFLVGDDDQSLTSHAQVDTLRPCVPPSMPVCPLLVTLARRQA